MAASDSSFGPQWLTSFDFTLSFENWFFTIAPAAVIIAMTPFYVRRYLRQTAVCRFDALFWAKLVRSCSPLDTAQVVASSPPFFSLLSWSYYNHNVEQLSNSYSFCTF